AGKHPHGLLHYGAVGLDAMGACNVERYVGRQNRAGGERKIEDGFGRADIGDEQSHPEREQHGGLERLRYPDDDRVRIAAFDRTTGDGLRLWREALAERLSAPLHVVDGGLSWVDPEHMSRT